MNFKARELRFCLKDKSQFDEEALKKALKAEGFPDVQVKTGFRNQESGIKEKEKHESTKERKHD
jgi:hypothetical protein